jgi:hypothetical protein
MIREEFINYIESIGFKLNDRFSYEYKEFKLYLHSYSYDFYNGSEWINLIPLNDLTDVLKLSRSIKLKSILLSNIS